MEGGGHNFFDDDVSRILTEFIDENVSNEQKEKWMQLMIMKRIKTPIITSFMLRQASIIELETISELGMFSYVLLDSHTGKLSHNENFGTLMRTKDAKCNEGGVTAGFAVIDDPVLYEELTGKVGETIKPTVSKL